jgi:hypothetical protein
MGLITCFGSMPSSSDKLHEKVLCTRKQRKAAKKFLTTRISFILFYHKQKKTIAMLSNLNNIRATIILIWIIVNFKFITICL